LTKDANFPGNNWHARIENTKQCLNAQIKEIKYWIKKKTTQNQIKNAKQCLFALGYVAEKILWRMNRAKDNISHLYCLYGRLNDETKLKTQNEPMKLKENIKNNQ